MSKVKIELPEGETGGVGHVEEGLPQDTQDLTTFIQTLLQQMQDKFQDMSDQMINRIDEMGNRIDDLEKNISDLMTQAGVDEPEK